MEGILAWLGTPLTEAGPLRLWMPLAAGAALAAALLVCLVILHRRRRKRRPATTCTPPPAPVTLRPPPLPVVEISNLQGCGRRESQQDAFGASLLQNYDTDGLLAVLCDGMGGLSAGDLIARETVAALLGDFPWQEDADLPARLAGLSRAVYGKFRGQGGTTLVAARLKAGLLSFWCVGDSDLFLLRGDRLYALNQRQEYKNDLLLRALQGAFPPERAYADPQAGALAQYIGKQQIRCDCLRRPLPLLPGDTLLLCSDGVSDTLTLAQIRQAAQLTPQACCEQLERDILAADRPNQDNYTAIVIRYHGTTPEEHNHEKEDQIDKQNAGGPDPVGPVCGMRCAVRPGGGQECRHTPGPGPQRRGLCAAAAV